VLATPAREACGVFGICAPGSDVARITFFALFALQHRGQESAGIATCDGRTAYVQKGMGLVTQVFHEENLRPLVGHLAIGHTRYSTTGSSHVRNAQPYVIETAHGPLGLAHNGNLTNAAALRRRLLERGVGLRTASDSEAINQMLAAPPPNGEPRGPDWVARIQTFMQQAEGAYSLVVLTRDAVFAVRDPLGLRPLCVGELLGDNGRPAGFVAASESCALGPVGGRFLREVAPGEIVRLDADGVHSIEGAPAAQRPAFCVFEYVYFARPDSFIGGQMVYGVRQRLGEILAEEAPSDADIVVGVPDSARPAAVGYAGVLRIPYSEGLIKNRYIGRTFIQPDERLRRSGARLKYNPVSTTLAGKRVVLIDDSIVRGVTMGPLVRLLRDGGASEVHVRISSPPVRHPCFMGVDMPTRAELIGAERDAEAIRQHVGADSLAYLSHEGMMRAVNDVRGGADPGHCSACFSGVYPLDVREAQAEQEGRKHAFEGIKG
jgi:amidophosphoribosyltransferase